MSFDNMTIGHHDATTLSDRNYSLAVFVILVSGLAVVTNTTVTVITLAVRSIRTATYSVFFVNLCFADLFGSAVAMGTSMMMLFGHSMDDDSDWLQILGGIQECTILVSVYTLAMISFEKYMYIKYPMRHEVCITLRKSLAVLSLSWMVGGFIAAFPKFGFGTYILHKSGLTFCINWNYELVNKAAAVNKGCFLFLLPFIAIGIISIQLYHVAKQAMISIEPMPSPLRPKTSTNSSKLDRNATIFVMDISDPDIKTGPTSEMGMGSSCILNHPNRSVIHPESKGPCQPMSSNNNNAIPIRPPNGIYDMVNNVNKQKVNRKALVLLTLPVCYFTIVWFPINLLYVVQAFDNDTPSGTEVEGHHPSEVAMFMLVLTSYALNPLVHGFVCKSFREHFVEAIRTCSCGDRDAVRPFSAGGSNEDFLEFLVHTSGSSQGDRERCGDAACGLDGPGKKDQLNVPEIA